MSLKDQLLRAEGVALCIMRKWWRPVTCLGIAGSMIVHGVVLPLMTRTSPDLTGLSALVTACAAAFAVREWGKIKGADQ